jgi:hypothetical protein
MVSIKAAYYADSLESGEIGVFGGEAFEVWMMLKIAKTLNIKSSC